MTKDFEKDFEIKNGVLVKYHGSRSDVVIPSRVSEIGEDAFYGCEKLYSITIPDSVTHIRTGAFNFCKGLTSISIPGSVIYIGDSAFSHMDSLTSISIPNSVTYIGDHAFSGCSGLISMIIPESVTNIGFSVFSDCLSLTSISIPATVTHIGGYAFSRCLKLTSIIIPDSVTSIGDSAFSDCLALESITIPDSVIKIGGGIINNTAFYNDASNWEDGVLYIGHHLIEFANHMFSGEFCVKPGTLTIAKSALCDIDSLTSVTMPNSVTSIGDSAFSGCLELSSIMIPDSVKNIGAGIISNTAYYRDDSNWENDVLYIGHHLIEVDIIVSGDFCIKPGTLTIADSAFCDASSELSILLGRGCSEITSIKIPDSVTNIGDSAFSNCTGFNTIDIPNNVKRIGKWAFSDCTGITSIIIPSNVMSIGEGAFNGCLKLTIVCRENSFAHTYAADNHLNYIFDYQYKAFHGMIPPGIEQMSSPFEADEEKPFIFISYSHKDRDEVLKNIKMLYESGWRIWYDEGLTIGDRYDETIREHVEDCSAFLLFVTENSVKSNYIKEYEIPWAIENNKPIIKCIFDEGIDYDLNKNCVSGTVSADEIEFALKKIKGVSKGKSREAKGISVAFNPTDREVKNGDNFAYCLYSKKSVEKAKAILHEANNNGCSIYDAVENGEDADKLQDCASLIVFLDKAFLSDNHLIEILTNSYETGRDIAICQIADITEDELPKQIKDIYHLHWLVFNEYSLMDNKKQLPRYLRKRGCVNSSILPGFEYKKTDAGIVITRYTGLDSDLRIEREYGSIPVVKIAEETFFNCINLKTITLSDGLINIGNSAFCNCTGLSSINIPDSVTSIGDLAFDGCSSLISITIPDGVTSIGERVFYGCSSLSSISIPDNLINIGKSAFEGCSSLISFAIPDGVRIIGLRAFYGCSGLLSISIPESVKNIEESAFSGCAGLESILVASGNTEYKSIGNCLIDLTSKKLIAGCKNSVIPNDGNITNIGRAAFAFCSGLSSIVIPDSVTRIEDWAFACCTSLASIIIPDTVTHIKGWAFAGCTRLSSITIPNCDTRIDNFAFQKCSKLTVYCSSGSYAEQYAIENEIPFILL